MIDISDIQNIVKVNMQGIQDIECESIEKRYIDNPGECNKEIRSHGYWVPDKGWEKLKVSVTGKSLPYDGITIQAWDGNVYHATNERLRKEGGERISKSGIVYNQNQRAKDDLWKALNFMKLPDFLDKKDIIIEGEKIVNNSRTVVVNINLTEGARDSGSYMRYYLDLARGGVPLKQLLYVQGELVKEVKDIVVIKKEGAYLPIKGDVYSKVHHQGREKVVSYEVLEESIKINQGLRQEIFTVDFEHGLFIWDDNLKTEYYYGVGVEPEENVDVELFDQRILEVKNQHKNRRQERDSDPNVALSEKNKDINKDVMPEMMSKPHKHNNIYYILCVLVILLAFIVLHCYFRRRN